MLVVSPLGGLECARKAANDGIIWIFHHGGVRNALVGDGPRVPICVVQLCQFPTQKLGVMDRGILGRCIICSVVDA